MDATHVHQTGHRQNRGHPAGAPECAVTDPREAPADYLIGRELQLFLEHKGAIRVLWHELIQQAKLLEDGHARFGEHSLLVPQEICSQPRCQITKPLAQLRRWPRTELEHQLSGVAQRLLGDQISAALRLGTEPNSGPPGKPQRWHHEESGKCYGQAQAVRAEQHPEASCRSKPYATGKRLRSQPCEHHQHKVEDQYQPPSDQELRDRSQRNSDMEVARDSRQSHYLGATHPPPRAFPLDPGCGTTRAYHFSEEHLVRLNQPTFPAQKPRHEYRLDELGAGRHAHCDNGVPRHRHRQHVALPRRSLHLL